MPVSLNGTCQCRAVKFRVDSHTPVPYQRCYCSICRLSAGGGGYAINLGGIADSLELTGQTATFHARLADGSHSEAERHFCPNCGSALWVYDARWPDLIHPFASAIETEVPVPPKLTHMMLDSKASWVRPDIGPEDDTFPEYPELSLADWHRQNGLWVD